jgi:hypothetical protein
MSEDRSRVGELPRDFDDRGLARNEAKEPPEVTDAEIAEVIDGRTCWRIANTWHYDPAGSMALELTDDGAEAICLALDDIERVVKGLCDHSLSVRTHGKSGTEGQNAMKIIEEWQELVREAAAERRRT